MECAKVAQEIARSPECDPALGGEPMIYLNIGEPDFTAPAPVIAAAEAALRAGRTQYTDAVGLPALRERISRWYASALGRRRAGAAHRRHRGRVGRAAAGLPGAVRGRRRGADARPELPVQPPLRGRHRRHGAAGADDAGDALPARRRRRARPLAAADARRAAGHAVEPDRHLDRAGRTGAHRRRRARARAASPSSTRSTRASATTRRSSAARWRSATTSSRSTASPSTSA